MRNITDIIENTVAWAEARLGSEEYPLMCLAFIEDALEQSNSLEIFGGDSARESADLYADSMQTGLPARGAFVFYDCDGGESRDWGHCGLSLGDGRVIHAWGEVRTDGYLDIENLAPAPGWTQPKYRGWVPVERVLKGCQDKA